MTWLPAARQKVFLSTLSLRRATRPAQPCKQPDGISIHALLAESDGLDVTIIGRTWEISIHALLAESDSGIIWRYFFGRRFLSTLSLRRATLADCTKF